MDICREKGVKRGLGGKFGGLWMSVVEVYIRKPEPADGAASEY